jgi:hypothetical protein
VSTLRAVIAVACCLGLSVAAAQAPANTQRASTEKTWPEVKCDRYKQAWSEAVRRGWTRRGVGQEFIDRHDAFLASGCTGPADVCPRSNEEIELANVLTIAAMNAGTASTFLPFACRR